LGKPSPHYLANMDRKKLKTPPTEELNEERLITGFELILKNEEQEKCVTMLRIANEDLAAKNKEKDIKKTELRDSELNNEARNEELIKVNIELKKSQEHQQEYIKSLEQIMYMTSHKIRQPVAHILGLSYLIENHTHSLDDLLKITNLIKDSAKSLDSSTRDLTKFIYDEKDKVKGTL
jgi:signal transduction histidine kinase